MRALKLGEVRELMRKANVPTLAMERDQVAAARKRCNPGDPFLRNMVLALSLHHWQNTAEDWQRLEAAIIVASHRGAVRR
jgi:hypothetical protein